MINFFLTIVIVSGFEIQKPTIIFKEVSLLENYDTVEYQIAFRIDTGKYNYLFDQSWDSRVPCLNAFVIRKSKFTDTGLFLLSREYMILNSQISDSNHFKIFTNYYKRTALKDFRKINSHLIVTDSVRKNIDASIKEFRKEFKGFDFYLFNVKVVISNYDKTDISWRWPSNDKRLIIQKVGYRAFVTEVISVEPIKSVSNG
jgi:hypothetical protein